MNGVRPSEDSEMERERDGGRGVVNDFKNLLLETGDWGPSFNEMCLESIQREEARCLREIFFRGGL